MTQKIMIFTLIEKKFDLYYTIFGPLFHIKKVKKGKNNIHWFVTIIKGVYRDF